MSARYTCAVWDAPRPRRTALRLLLLCLADSASDGGDHIIEVSTLARRCAISRRRIREYLDLLENARHVVVWWDDPDPDRLRYQLLWPASHRRPARDAAGRWTR